jgi:group I intron endonuclease
MLTPSQAQEPNKSEVLHSYSLHSHIYKLTDLRNGKIYIGKYNKGKNKTYFTGGIIPKRIIKKHGIDTLKREIIVQGNFNDLLLNQLEIHYIRLFASKIPEIGYNLTDGGDGSLGREVSKETRLKISKSNKGKIITLEMKRKISKSSSGKNNHNFGKRFSKEVRAKMSASKSGENHPMYGKKLTEKFKKRLSELKKGFVMSEEQKIKISNARKALSKKKCPYCSKIVDPSNYGRYHGDKCKQKPIC